MTPSATLVVIASRAQARPGRSAASRAPEMASSTHMSTIRRSFALAQAPTTWR